MFMIDYKRPRLADLLGMEKPRDIRINVKLDEWGNIVYTPQAKWFFKWYDNHYSTRKVKTLMWTLYGPKASKGVKVEDLDIVGDVSFNNKAHLRDAMIRQARKLDFFPSDPPKEERV